MKPAHASRGRRGLKVQVEWELGFILTLTRRRPSALQPPPPPPPPLLRVPPSVRSYRVPRRQHRPLLPPPVRRRRRARIGLAPPPMCCRVGQCRVVPHQPDLVSPFPRAQASPSPEGGGWRASPPSLISVGTCPVLMMRRRPGHALASTATVRRPGNQGAGGGDGGASSGSAKPSIAGAAMLLDSPAAM
jgi:hypothetical protein